MRLRVQWYEWQCTDTDSISWYCDIVSDHIERSEFATFQVASQCDCKDPNYFSFTITSLCNLKPRCSPLQHSCHKAIYNMYICQSQAKHCGGFNARGNDQIAEAKQWKLSGWEGQPWNTSSSNDLPVPDSATRRPCRGGNNGWHHDVRIALHSLCACGNLQRLALVEPTREGNQPWASWNGMRVNKQNALLSRVKTRGCNVQG